MSDIHQEWRELRVKNGDFICHLDGEVAKLEKKQVELENRKRLQDLADAGAFAMQFAVPFNCCQDDRDDLKALNKAQADRIKYLEDAILAYKEQLQIDSAVKKELDEKLDKAAADYKALWVEKEQLKEQVASYNRVNAGLRQSNDRLQSVINSQYGLYSYDVQKGMQSKIAKQAAEIKRLTEENKSLRRTCGDISLEYADLAKQFRTSEEENKQLHKAIDASLSFAEIKRLTEENEQLHKALDIAAKDAEANFERGKIKGMSEIWDELMDVYAGRLGGENEKIFGYCSVGDVLMNLSPTWFMNKAREYHEQKEKEEARDIKLGDEVEIFDQCDHSLSDIGIVIAMDKDDPCFAVIGPQFEACFTKTDIDAGNVKKTGRHFDTIPLDYLA